MIWGADDRVISDVPGSIRAADRILKVRQVVIPKCGHAPQIEKSRLVNHLVIAVPPRPAQDDPADARPGAVPAPRAAEARRSAAAGFSAGSAAGRFTRLPMNDFSLFLGKFLTARDGDRQPRPEQPLAVADDGPQRRLGPGRGARRAGRRHRADHPGARRAGARPTAGSSSSSATPTSPGLLRERFGDLPNFDVVEGDVRDLAEHPRRPRDRPGRPRHLGPARPVVPARTSSATSSGSSGRSSPPEGTYNQITEMPWVYWRFYRKFFDDVQFVFEPRNLPPAGAYFCRGVEGHALTMRDAAPAHRPARRRDRPSARPSIAGFHAYARRRTDALAPADPVASPGADPPQLAPTGPATRFGRDHGFAAIRSVADFQAAVPLRTYEDLWDDYLARPLPGLRRPDLAGPHPVPRPDQRHDAGGDQVHPGLARDGRLEPQGGADDGRLPPGQPARTRGSSTAGSSSWAARPTCERPRPASAQGDLSGIAASEVGAAAPTLHLPAARPGPRARLGPQARAARRAEPDASRSRSSAACRAGCSSSSSGCSS